MASTKLPPLAKITSYSGFHSVKAPVYAPQSIEELKTLVIHLNKKEISYSTIGSGISFDSQGHNANVLISTKNLTHIQLDLEHHRIIVGTGTQWSDIVEAIVPHGYVPYCAPTTQVSTTGGTLSCNTYSRFSAGYGRESKSILSFRILTTTGTILHCSREENPELFYGTIGGLGLLGIVLEIEYKVLFVGKNPTLYTTGQANEGMENVEVCHPDYDLPIAKGEKFPGAGFILYTYRGKLRNLSVKHRWVDSTLRRGNPLHKHKSNVRIVGDFILRAFPKLSGFAWNIFYIKNKYFGQSESFDSPKDGMFYMDTNRLSRQLSKKLGFKTPIIQQSFSIPCIFGDSRDIERSKEFASLLIKNLTTNNLVATMIDIGFMPKGDDSLLSCNRDQDTYLVSVALEGRGIPSYSIVEKVMFKMSELCFNLYGGKVHLTKNVLCAPQTLEKMYAGPLAAMKRLKAKYDPQWMLGNTFVNRLLPSLAKPDQELPEDSGVSLQEQVKNYYAALC